MNFEILQKDDFTVLVLAGDVDLEYSPIARTEIIKYLNNGSNLFVDLSAVTYIDSSGVASLVEGYQLAKGKALNFGLVGVSDSAMKVIQLAKLDKIFSIYSSIEAIAS
jgi:anti-sigma B factor antagonist